MPATTARRRPGTALFWEPLPEFRLTGRVIRPTFRPRSAPGEGAMTRRAAALFLLMSLGLVTEGLRAQTVSVTTPLGGDPLVVEGFRGNEGASALFSFTLDFAAMRGRVIPFDGLLGQDVTVTMTQANGSVRHFNGMVTRFSAGRLDTRAHYSMEFGPKAWLLTRQTTSRIFEQESVPAIVRRILDSVPGLAYEMRLASSYPERDHVVQRNETDFAFISRLLEDEGIFYFFRHDAAGHVMVLADTPQGAGEIPGVKVYRTGTFLPPPPGSVIAWEKSQEIRSGKVTLRDHNFQLPGDDLEAQAVLQESVTAGAVEHHLTAGGAAALEQFDFPGGYAQRFDGIDPGGAEQPAELAKIVPEGQRVALIRMQEEAAHALVIEGQSTAPDLAPGHLFTLGGVMAQFNGKYYVTGVTHKYTPSNGSGSYSNTFRCIPSGLPYRPPRVTPKPALPGLETAVVIAPPGEEVFTDKYARVKVKFAWDRTGQDPQGGGTTSCWVRVASPWAGAGSGTGSGPVILPRVGWEVLVAFEGGDPDRPIIVGSVYNADHLPPPER
jgi:type VI secretion system secreted protein VgrG